MKERKSELKGSFNLEIVNERERERERERDVLGNCEGLYFCL